MIHIKIQRNPWPCTSVSDRVLPPDEDFKIFEVPSRFWEICHLAPTVITL